MPDGRKTPEARKRAIARIEPYQWKKGQSGNPQGGRVRRPKPLTILDEFYRLLDEESPKDGKRFARLCAEAMGMAILRGNAQMTRLAIEYESGSPEHARASGDELRQQMRDVFNRWLRRDDEQTEDADYEELGDGEE